MRMYTCAKFTNMVERFIVRKSINWKRVLRSRNIEIRWLSDIQQVWIAHTVIWFQHCGAIFYIKSMSVSVDRETERKKKENKQFL